MSSSLKKIKRSHDLMRRKAAVKAMKTMERVVGNMPKKCYTCDVCFDPKVPGALDSWHISISQDATLMTCPVCWANRSVQ